MGDWLKRQFAEFIGGATKPSLPALAGTLCAAIGALVACMCFVTPGFVATTAGEYLVKRPGDHYGHVTAEALRIAGAKGEELNVVVIGDSMLHEAISNPGELREQLVARLGRPVSVHMLTAGGLTQWEALPLVDCIRDHMCGVVVLEITPYNLSMVQQTRRDRVQRPRLALDSPALAEEAHKAHEKPPRRFGNYFLDHFWFFVARVDSVLTIPAGPEQHEVHLRDERRPWGNRQWRAFRSRISGWMKTYQAEHAKNLDLYARVLGELAGRQTIAVALLEGVENPRNMDLVPKGAGRRMHQKYHADVAAFAQRQGVAYLDLAEAAKMVPDDFLDYAHVHKPEARRRFTAVLADRLAELIRSHFDGGKP